MIFKNDNNSPKAIKIQCDCLDPSHVVTFERWDDEFANEIYVYVALNPYMKLWRRLKEAFKFIINRTKGGGFCHFDTCTIVKKDATELRAFLSNFIADNMDIDYYAKIICTNCTNVNPIIHECEHFSAKKLLKEIVENPKLIS